MSPVSGLRARCLRPVRRYFLFLCYETMSNCSQNCWIDWNSLHHHGKFGPRVDMYHVGLFPCWQKEKKKKIGKKKRVIAPILKPTCCWGKGGVCGTSPRPTKFTPMLRSLAGPRGRTCPFCIAMLVNLPFVHFCAPFFWQMCPTPLFLDPKSASGYRPVRWNSRSMLMSKFLYAQPCITLCYFILFNYSRNCSLLFCGYWKYSILWIDFKGVSSIGFFDRPITA